MVKETRAPRYLNHWPSLTIPDTGATRAKLVDCFECRAWLGTFRRKLVLSTKDAMNEERKTVLASEAGIAIQAFGDIADALSVCFGTAGLLLTEQDLTPEFFNLRSGLAGELFQKFINYGIRVAIVLPDTAIYGERFSELAYEHASHPLIRFLGSREEALAWLSA